VPCRRVLPGRPLLVSLAAALLLAACSSPAAAPAPPPAHVVARQQLDARLWDITVDSPAVGGPVPVRLLLPTRYAGAPTQRWPVLYLLHGCCDSYLSWTRSTDIEELTATSDVVVVMPDGGRVGFYSDWRSGPGWETFHTVELPRLLAQEYRAGGREAVAGVSMGGLGALDYAAHHPGRYVVAASISGVVHTRLSPEVSQDYLGLIRSEGADPEALWGDPAGDAATWAQHNPFDLVDGLRGVRLFVAAGDGSPGPLDPPGPAPDRIETSIGAQNRAFAEQLQARGVDAQLDLYGPGTHNWVYWQRELHRAWPLITAGLGVG
jgi:diacylglycerol O-acyltransferase / trehalose O-mycolyltransferase